MRRSIFQSGAALLSVAALGAAGALFASAADATVSPPVFDAPGIPQAGFSVAFDKHAVSAPTAGLGFESVPSTAAGFASKYQNTDESLYLYSSALGSLDSALASGKNLPSFFTASVSESTSVPLPAAGWLLGTGLLGLIAIARPRRLGPQDLNASSGSSQASPASAEKKPQGEVLKAKPQGEASKAWDRDNDSELRWFGAYSSRLLG